MLVTLQAMQSHILITGASKGIGRATAQRLAREGKNLLLLARDAEQLETLKKEIREYAHVDIVAKPLDVTDHKALEALFAEIKTLSLEAVINNAGMALGREPLENTPFEDVLAMVDLNINAFLHVAQLSIPFLKKSRGHLINIGSIAGLEMYEGGSVYAGTKHLVHGVTKGLRIDLLGTGVRVTEVAPGNVDTHFSITRYKGDRERAAKAYEGYEPLHAEDIADAIWYAFSRPKHVNIEHLLIMPTAQASAMRIARK